METIQVELESDVTQDTCRTEWRRLREEGYKVHKDEEKFNNNGRALTPVLVEEFEVSRSSSSTRSPKSQERDGHPDRNTVTIFVEWDKWIPARTLYFCHEACRKPARERLKRESELSYFWMTSSSVAAVQATNDDASASKLWVYT